MVIKVCVMSGRINEWIHLWFIRRMVFTPDSTLDSLEKCWKEKMMSSSQSQRFWIIWSAVKPGHMHFYFLTFNWNIVYVQTISVWTIFHSAHIINTPVAEFLQAKYTPIPITQIKKQKIAITYKSPSCPILVISPLLPW